MSEIVALQKKYDLPASLAKLLLMLADRDTVTAYDIEEYRCLAKEAKSAVWRLRRVMAEHGIDIKSRREVGYWMEDSDRETVKAAAGR